MSIDSCSIQVEVPPKASREKIEKKIKEKLKTEWTDLSRCKKEITITVVIKHPDSKTGRESA
jgi:DNA-directed RNA polymerase subunit E'/Rpb7